LVTLKLVRNTSIGKRSTSNSTQALVWSMSLKIVPAVQRVTHWSRLRAMPAPPQGPSSLLPCSLVHCFRGHGNGRLESLPAHRELQTMPLQRLRCCCTGQIQIVRQAQASSLPSNRHRLPKSQSEVLSWRGLLACILLVMSEGPHSISYHLIFLPRTLPAAASVSLQRNSTEFVQSC